MTKIQNWIPAFAGMTESEAGMTIVSKRENGCIENRE
jgi:hypothetical protein